MQIRNWDIIKDFIKDKKNILVATHINPDGDGIGSQIALAEYLKQLNKTVYLYNTHPTPVYFQFLDPNKEIICFNKSEHFPIFQTFDAAIVVDISDWQRLGDIGPVIKELNIPIACIDHHIPGDMISDSQIIDSSASSAGELVYDLLISSNAEMTEKINNAIYASILTDTGSFRFSNTNVKTHLIAADMLKRGVDISGIYSKIYETHSKNRAKLTGLLLSRLQYACNDRLVWYVLTNDIIQQTGAEMWEVEGLSELTRNIENIEISLMFTEVAQGTKVSFRSKGIVPINGLAGIFGGGGHKFASGASLPMQVDKAVELVVNEAKKALNNKI